MEVTNPAAHAPPHPTQTLAQAASPLGLRLLGVTALEPRGASRGLRGLSRSGHLLGGSVEGGDDADTDVASFESSEGAAPQTASLYVRAIIATSAAEQGEGVAALVRLARTEAVAVWGERLSAAGLPVAGIEVVSLQPHAPTSIEAKLQAQLMIVQELHGTGSGGSNGSGTTATLTVSDYEVPSADAYRSPAMGPGGVPSLVAAAALCAGLAGLAMLRARRAASRQAAASSVILSVADGKALAV